MNEYVLIWLIAIWLLGIPVMLYLSYRFDTIGKYFGHKEWIWQWPMVTLLYIMVLPFYFIFMHVLNPLGLWFIKLHYRIYRFTTQSMMDFENFRRQEYPTEEESTRDWIDGVRRISNEESE